MVEPPPENAARSELPPVPMDTSTVSTPLMLAKRRLDLLRRGILRGKTGGGVERLCDGERVLPAVADEVAWCRLVAREKRGSSRTQALTIGSEHQHDRAGIRSVQAD